MGEQQVIGSMTHSVSEPLSEVSIIHSLSQKGPFTNMDWFNPSMDKESYTH